MLRTLLLASFAVLVLAVSFVRAAPQIMPLPKEGKWTGSKATLTVVYDRTTEDVNDFGGKLTIKNKTYDYRAVTDSVKGTHGVYSLDGEPHAFEFVFDPNKNTGTIKISDPYQELEVKWTAANDKPKE
jgi:hypothetical protein